MIPLVPPQHLAVVCVSLIPTLPKDLRLFYVCDSFCGHRHRKYKHLVYHRAACHEGTHLTNFGPIIRLLGIVSLIPPQRNAL